MADQFAPGVNIGNPAGYIKGLINEGESATSGLDIFRSDGGAIRTQTWFQLYGEVNASMIRAGDAAGLDPYVLPGPSDYSEWAMGTGGQYVTQVNVFVVDRDTGLVGTINYTYVTDEPHTPAEAEAAAFDEYSDADTQDSYGQTVQGTSTANVYRTVSWPR